MPIWVSVSLVYVSNAKWYVIWVDRLEYAHTHLDKYTYLTVDSDAIFISYNRIQYDIEYVSKSRE